MNLGVAYHHEFIIQTSDQESKKDKAVPLQACSGPEGSIKVKQSRYRPAVAQRVP
jgi:hypothetical protein